MRLLVALVAAVASAAAVDLKATPPAGAEEGLLFHETFEDADSIAANDGAISGSITFESGVAGNAANMSLGFAEFPLATNFDPSAGRVEFEFKPITAVGGMFDIGTLGTASSMGVFNNSGRTWFEYRGAAGSYLQLSAAVDLTTPAWLHIEVSWRCLEGSGINLMQLSVDGDVSFRYATPSCVQPAPTDVLRVGWSGFYGGGAAVIDEFKVYDRLADDATSVKSPSNGPVQIIDRQLRVNGDPFIAKGVGYQPTPIGLQGSNVAASYCDPSVYGRDLAFLEALGVNTIRTWSEVDCGAGVTNTAFLDAVEARGIRVVMGYWIDYGSNFADANVRAAFKSAFRSYVARYKSHAAVLGWGIGNENNLVTNMDAQFYSLANELALEAYVEEGAAYHPTILVNGDIGEVGIPGLLADDASLAYVDVWGANVYRGASFGLLFQEFAARSGKPLFLTEFGTDALDHETCLEHEQVQSDWATALFGEIFAHSAIAIGGTLMEYSDEWWKAGSNLGCAAGVATWSLHDNGGFPSAVDPDAYKNEEWWGIVRIADNGVLPDVVSPRQAYYDLQSLFGGNPTLDSDGDGCLDVQEVGPEPQSGGRRSPYNPHDFYDVNGSKIVDAVDIGLVRFNFNSGGPTPPEDAIYDRSVGTAAWAPGPPDDMINAVDIALVRNSFNHSCLAPP